MWAALLALLGSPASAAPLLAVTPIRMHTNLSREPLFDYDATAPVTADADVVSLHEDAIYGVPWEHFLSGGAVPAPAFWTEHLRTLQAHTSPGGPWAAAGGVFLSLSLVNHGGGRTCPAGNASSAANANAPFSGCTACFDFDPSTNPRASAVRAAYIAYASAMVRAVEPRWMCHAVEVNMYRRACGATKWAALVSFANEVYAAIKSLRPALTVFPSFQSEFLRGEDQGGPCHGADVAPCLDEALPAIAPMSRDLFAVSAYAYMEGVTSAPNATPPADFTNYLEAIIERLDGSEPLAVAETGFLTTTLRVRDFAVPTPRCFPLLASTDVYAAGWVGYLLRLARASDRWKLLTWWSDVDFLPASVQSGCFLEECTAYSPPLSGADLVFCSATQGFRAAAVAAGQPAWSGEANFKVFGNMGLRQYDTLQLKPLLGATWRSACASCHARALPAVAT